MQSANLATYQQVMAYDDGEVLESDSHRDTRKLALGNEVLFLKRTRVEKIRAAFESYALGHGAHAKPYGEKLQLDQLAACGFATAQVVAAGEKLKFGIPIEGFLITRQAPGQCLETLLSVSDERTRALLMSQMGALLGQLHRAGFFLPVRLKDVFHQSDNPERPHLTLIDRETRHPKRRRFSRKRALRSLGRSLRRQLRSGEEPTAGERKHFARSYCSEVGEVWPQAPSQLIHALRARWPSSR